MNLALDLIEQAAREERLAHFLLFHGGSAQDRQERAIRLALILNCRQPSLRGPCQECPSCRKILSGNHPDVFVLKSDKATLGIEEVLAWQEWLYRKHYEGKYKVFLISQGDGLTAPAANALLKVVEEPPERTLIIISAGNAEGVLPTLRSRSQLVYFPDSSEDAWLAQFSANNRPEAAEAYKLSGGVPPLAAEILEQGVARVKEWMGQFWRAVEARDFLELFPLFPLERNEALLFLQVLFVQVKEEIKGGHGKAPFLLAIGEALDALRQQANSRLVIEVLALRLFRQGGKPL